MNTCKYFNFKKRSLKNFLIPMLVTILFISGCDDYKPSAQNAVLKPTNEPKSTNQSHLYEGRYLYPIRVEEDNKAIWGYIDNSGKVVIHPRWDGAESFNSYGIGTVYNYDSITGTNNYGIVNFKGDEIIPIKKGSWNFPVMGPEYIVSYGCDDDGIMKSIVYDMSGKQLFITDKFIDRYSDDHSIFCSDGLWGLIDKTGKVIKSGVEDGNELIEKSYKTIDVNTDKLTIFEDSDEVKYGLKNSKGEVIVPAKYDNITEYDNGEIFYCQNVLDPFAKPDLLGKDGKLIPFKNASDIQYCSNGLCLVCFDSDFMHSMRIMHKYKIYDIKTGSMSDPVYVPGINRIVENSIIANVISVYDGNKSFLIGRDGKQIAGSKIFEGKWIISYEGNLLKASSQSFSCDDEFFAYYNQDGKEIWKTNYEFDIGNGRTLKKMYYSPSISYSASFFELKDAGNSDAEEKINSQIKKVLEGKLFMDKEFQIGIECKYLVSNDLLTVIHTQSSYSGGGMGNYDNYYYHFNLNTGDQYENLSFLKDENDSRRKLQELVKKRFDSKYKEVGMYPEVSLDKLTKNNYFTPEGIVFILDGYKFSGSVLIKFSEIESLIDRNAEIFKSCDLSKYAPYVEDAF